ncbi:translocation/assembly module TamB domain-containing protein [Pseudoxanthobacter sp. M-2]|uniref:translocation/assembly module TamB domain-containing protein n=1 Tax=Pseudoxanthobacter sp. M-2 TaxID=3078754 RepID=UPI0038FC356D
MLVVLLVLVGAVAAIVAFALFTSPGRQGLVALAERFSPSFGYPVTIGGFSDEGLGALRFTNVTVGDGTGPFVEIDTLALDWRPSALFDRTVSVDRLALGPTRVLRAPQSEPTPDQPSSGLPLPLPVAIDVRTLEVAGVALDPAVAGEALTVAANGALAVPRSLQEPITIDLDAMVEGRLPGRAVVDIDYRPADDHLTAAVDLTAPAGGVIQRLAGLSGDQPLTLRYQGDGPLSAWEGTLDVALGATALARGNTRIEEIAAGRRVTTGLYLTPAPVLPAEYAALAGDAVQAAMVVVVEPGGVLAIESASVSAAAASVMAQGRIDPDADTIDVAAEVEVASAQAFAGLLDIPATWNGGHVNARLTGRLADPDIAATVRADGVAALGRVTAGNVDVTATMTAPQPGTLGIGGAERTIVFEASTASVGLDGAPISSEAAPRVSGEVRLPADGTIAFSDVVLDALGARLALDGTTSAGAVDADARLTVADLSALSGLAGVPLAGSVDLTADVDAALDGSRAAVTLDGGAQALSAGIPELEALIGTSPTVSAAIAYDGTSLSIERLDVAGGVVTATGSGRIGGSPDDALTVDLTVSDLALVTPTLTGAARLEATATGDPTAPRVAFRLTGDQLVAAGHALDDFAATGDVDLTVAGTQSGTVALAGASRGQPITGTVRFARTGEDMSLAIDRLDFVGLTASGTLAQSAAGMPSGQLSLTATDLAPAAALAGLVASGGLDATVDIPAGEPGVARITLASPSLTVEGNTIAGLSARGTVAGLPGTPSIDVTADIAGIEAAALPGVALLREYAGLADGQVMTVRYQGSGAPEDLDSRIDVALAGTPVLGGTATVAASDAGTRVTADLALTAASRLPPNLAALAGETVRVSLAAVAAPDGTVAIEAANVTAAAGTVAAQGNLNPGADSIDVTADITVSDSAAFAGLVPAATSWSGGRGTAHLTGRLADPDVKLDAVVDGVASADRLTAERVTVAATSTAPAEDAADTVGREATFTVTTEGVTVGGNPVEADAAPRLSGAATLNPDGGVTLRDVALTGLGADVTLAATTTAEAATADGRIRVADLAYLSGLAGQPLTGALDLTGTLDAALDGSRLSLALDGGATGFSAGVPEVEALLGPTPTVDAAIAYDGETLTIDRLRVAGGVITAEGKGALGAANDTLTLDLAVTDLARITPTLAGAARLTATATGDALAPNVAFRLAGDGLVAAGNRLDGFTATGDLDLTKPGAQSGTVVLTGSSQGRPIAGTIRFGRDANGERLDIERLAFVGLTASGALTRGADGIPAGRLNVVATDLAPAAALAGLVASGGLEANIEMPTGRQGPARITVASRRLSVAGNTVANLAVNGSITGLPAAPRVDLTATAGEVVTGGTAISNLRATATGALDDANVTADARVNGLAVSTAARVQRRTDGAIDVALSRASASGNGAEIALSRPATVRVDANGGVRVDAALAARGGGTVTVTGTVSAQSLSLQARLQQVPLALARLANAELPVAGTISGSATINGTPAAPRGNYDLTLAGLSSPQAAGLPPVAAQVRGAVEPTRVTVNGTATAGTSTRLTFNGAVPLGAGQIGLTVSGNTDLALVELFGLPPTMDVGGRATLDARIAGTTAAPAVTGTVRISGGSFADITNDLRIEGIASEIRLDTRTARIASFSGRFADGGTLTVTGSIGLDANAGFPGDLRVATQRAVVRNEPIARGIVDANVTITGPLARAPVIGGTVRLDRVEVTIPDRLPGSATTIPVTHTNVPPERRQFFPQPNPRGPNGRAAPPPPPFDARLDLTVTAINQIVVRGSGINADFGGNFRITGTTRAPVVNGGLRLRRGIVDIIGQRLTITTGTISFADTLDPILDLEATTRSGSYTAIVSITGRASAPVIRFSSVPQLPEDEVLSVILFGQLSAGLNAGQAIALAEAVASLTGARSGGLLAGLRSRLGVDRLGVVTDANNRPAIEIGGYATDNVFVGVQQGAGADSTRVKVQVDITDYLNVQGQLGADGSSALGVGVEVDY